MSDIDLIQQKESDAYVIVGALEKINNKIAKLRLEKEELERQLIDLIGHDKEGSKTYQVMDKNITLKTDMIYSLDKAMYNEGFMESYPEYDPVIVKSVFEIDKKRYKDIEISAPKHVIAVLSALITKKPAKPSVTIKARS